MRLADTVPLADGGAYKLQAAATRGLGRRDDALFQWTDDRICRSALVYKAYQTSLGLQIGAVQRMGAFDPAAPSVRARIEARAKGRVDEHEAVVAPSSRLTHPHLVVRTAGVTARRTARGSPRCCRSRRTPAACRARCRRRRRPP